jgi:anti-sigma factor RsiW
VEISLDSLDHLDENVLEEYVFGRLGNAKSAVVEEHLLICPLCQTALTETDEYIRLMKYAASRQTAALPVLVPRSAPAAKPVQPIAVRQPQTWYRPMQVGMGILAACAAVFMLTQGFSLLRQPTPVSLALVSYRGPLMIEAAGGRPLDLSISAADVPPAPEYRLEIVNAGGKLIWSDAASIGGGKLSAHVPKPLTAGQYWIRLYGRPSELLAEYGLRVK